MMNTITDQMLRAIMPNLASAKRALYLPHLIVVMPEFEINTRLRAAAFLAQLAHESTELACWEENLNYSAKRLVEVWPKRFPTLSSAAPCARNPQALAEKVYGGRMGNLHPGDGWKFRGRCPIQATGREMYLWLSSVLRMPLVDNPDLLLQPGPGLRAAAAIFAVRKNCNPLADRGDIVQITRAINGGTNGLAERQEYYSRALEVIPKMGRK
jgi:putative chitinase